MPADVTIKTVAVTSSDGTTAIGTGKALETVTVSKDKDAEVNVSVELDGTAKATFTGASIVISADVAAVADATKAGKATVSVGTKAADGTTRTGTWKGTLKIHGVQSGDVTVTVKAGFGDTDGNLWDGSIATAEGTTVTFTVHVVSAEVKAEDTTNKGTVSPDVKAITFSPTSASVTVDATKTVTATVTLSGDSTFASKDVTVTVTPKASATATAVKSGDVVVGSKKLSFDIVVTGKAAGTTSIDVTVKVGTGEALTSSFKVTVTTASETDTTETVSPDIDWYSTSTAYAFNNKTWTLYLSKDKAGVTQTAAIVVSSDFTATPALVLTPTSNDYVKFTLGSATKATSTDERGNVYTFSVTATPKSTDMTGSAFKVYAKVTSGSTVLSTDVLSFTVLVSNDKTTSGDSGSEGGSTITDWTLTATADKTEFNLSYYEKAEVTITAKPADEGVDFVITTDADESDGYTLESDDGNFSTTGYVVKYTFTAGETEGEFPIKFTVTATSGDDEQTESVDVVFTVEFNEAKQAAPAKPIDATTEEFGVSENEHKEVTVNLLGGGTKTFTLYGKTAREQAFKDGNGLVAWAVRAPYKVKPTFGRQGWWLRFFAKLLKDYFTVTLNAANEFGKPASSMVTIAATEQNASRDAAVSVAYLAEDDNGYSGAVFEVDVAKAAAGLPAGDTYDVETTYTTEAAADAAGDNAKLSEPDVAGTMEGKQDTSGGGEQGGGEQGGGEQGGGDDGKETIDNLLGGTSGGCDAGFGALALALAATMIFVRKRS